MGLGIHSSCMARSREIIADGGWPLRVAVLTTLAFTAMAYHREILNGQRPFETAMVWGISAAVMLPVTVYAIAQGHVMAEGLRGPRPAHSPEGMEDLARRCRIATYAISLLSLLVSAYAILQR